jgi:TolA-binding protein
MAYYTYLYNSYIGYKDYDKAEKIARTQARRDAPNAYRYELDQAYALKLAAKNDKADDIYQNLARRPPSQPFQIIELTNVLAARNENNFAIDVLETVKKNTNTPPQFGYELADLYYKTNKIDKCFATYFEIIDALPDQLMVVQNKLQDKIEADADREKFRILLLKKTQQNPDNIALTELLVWYFVQQNNFTSAFNQLKILEKRTNGDYARIFVLATQAVENNYFDDAMQMYQYITTQAPTTNPYYYTAQIEYLDTYKKRLDNQPSTQNDYKNLSNDYKIFFDKNGYNTQNIALQRSYANLLGYRLQTPTAAINILDSALKIPGIAPRIASETKLELADLYLIAGDVWEPTLLYGQVEKSYKDEPLGQMAKFKNAKLSFYRAEFEWAKAQCDVLKASTAQKISNDAIQLSLLIQDNTIGDSVVFPLKMYAAADLYTFQNKYDSANIIIDTLLKNYDTHGIHDEALYLKAKIYEQQQNYTDALNYYEKVTQQHADDILADDALYAVAMLYDTKLNDPAQAQETYKKLLLKYPDSLYSQQARKRIRTLRGDIDKSGTQQEEYLKN